MKRDIEREVRQRAGELCEYCRTPSAFAQRPFQIDHVISEQHGGRAVLENLALSVRGAESRGCPSHRDAPRIPSAMHDAIAPAAYTRARALEAGACRADWFWPYSFLRCPAGGS